MSSDKACAIASCNNGKCQYVARSNGLPQYIVTFVDRKSILCEKDLSVELRKAIVVINRNRFSSELIPFPQKPVTLTNQMSRNRVTAVR